MVPSKTKYCNTSKVKVSKDNVTYYVDEEKKRVVCVIRHTRSFLTIFLNDYWYEFCPYDLKNDKRLWLPDKFVGVAICSDEDTFDVEIGKKVAYDKAIDKLFKAFFVRANWFICSLDEQLNYLMNDFNQYGWKLDINSAYRKKVILEMLEKQKKA